MTEQELQNKIDNLLRRLQQEGKIKVEGYGKGSIWILADNQPAGVDK